MKTSLLRVSLAILLCFSGSTAIFSQSILNILASATDLSCNVENGTPDGRIEIQVSGGTPAYTFQWTGPGVNPTSQNQAGLIAGTYYLTVTDSQGQTQTDEYILSEPEALDIAEVLYNPCNYQNGELNGSIDLTVSGGTAPYTYNWTGPGIVATSEDQYGLGAGTHCVRVTDANGCEQEKCFELDEPDELIITESIEQPSCNNADGYYNGTITIVTSGGTAPLTYSWTGPGSVFFHQNQSSLGAGSYCVTITGADGCEAEKCFDLTEPEELDITETIVQPSCNRADGTWDGLIDLVVSGGTAPYTFEWAGPNIVLIDQNQNGLGSGTYTVIATDATGLCTYTETYELREPEAMKLTATVVNPSCHVVNGTANGTINLLVSGGSAPYSFDWTGPDVVPSAQDQSGLSAGTRCVTVTDANGCTIGECWDLTAPEEIDIFVTATPILCNGDLSKIIITAEGATPNNTYHLSGTTTLGAVVDYAIQPSNEFFASAGTYTVTTYDANGCESSETFDITEPEALNITDEISQPTCNPVNGDLNGTIDLVVSGGTAPYTFDWAGPGINPVFQNQTGLGEGTYTVVVTDATGLCTYSETYELTEPDPISILASIKNPSCNVSNGELDGSIDIVVTGGTAPYAFDWTGPNLIETSQNQVGLGTGTHSVLVTDASGCTFTEHYELQETDAIQISKEVIYTSCQSSAASIRINNISGGTPPYTYEWSTGDTQPEVSVVAAGVYTVTVSDANSCRREEEFEILADANYTVSVYRINTDCQTRTVDYEMEVNGYTGPYTISWATATGGTLTIIEDDLNSEGGKVRITGLQQDHNYTFTITDNSGCSFEEEIIVTETDIIVPTPTLCIVTTNEDGHNEILWEDGGEGGDIRHHSIYRQDHASGCLLYTSPSPRDATLSRMPSSA